MGLRVGVLRSGFFASPAGGAGRLAALDGLRGVLAVYVMLSHLAPFAALPDWVVAPFAHGGAAVDVFFVLSGLVITRSLDRFAWRPGPFLRARARRILPLYLAVLALAVAIQPLSLPFPAMGWIGPVSPGRFIWSGGWPADGWAVLAAHLTMTHGLFPRGVLPWAWVGFLGAAWSLSTEFQFYALVALIAAAGGQRWRGALPWLFLALAAAGLSWGRVAPPGWVFSRAFLPNAAQYFALGIAGALWVDRPQAWWRHAAVLAGTLVLCFLHGGIGKLAAPLVWTACLATERGVPAPLLAAPLATSLGSLLRRPALRWLGSISYALYLVNEPVQKLLGIVLACLARGNSAWFTILWVPLAILLPLAAAWGLHRTIEAPPVPLSRRGRFVLWS